MPEKHVCREKPGSSRICSKCLKVIDVVAACYYYLILNYCVSLAIGPPCQSEKVRLNVGGQIFETSTGTLRRDESSLLACMVSKNLALKPEPDGSYFIDRDPSHFRYILNYLRDLKVTTNVAPSSCYFRPNCFEKDTIYCFPGTNEVTKQTVEIHNSSSR